MARTNYGFQKRQKELAKQAKKEEKRQRKLERKAEPEGEETAELPAEGGVNEAESPVADAANADADEPAEPAG